MCLIACLGLWYNALTFNPLWLSVCVSLNFPTSPYLVSERYQGQFADHNRMKVGRSFWKRKRMSRTKALLSLKKCNHNNGQSLIRSRGYSEHSLINFFQLRLWSTLLWVFIFLLIFKSLIDYFPIAHNTLCLPPKFCITYCLKMLLGKCNTPRSI